jgi:hypothetical protein
VIKASALLVALAIGLLVAGVAGSSLLMVYVSIGVCAVAALLLAAGVLAHWSEIFGRREARPATPGAWSEPQVNVTAPVLASIQAVAVARGSARPGREEAGVRLGGARPGSGRPVGERPSGGRTDRGRADGGRVPERPAEVVPSPAEVAGRADEFPAPRRSDDLWERVEEELGSAAKRDTGALSWPGTVFPPVPPDAAAPAESGAPAPEAGSQGDPRVGTGAWLWGSGAGWQPETADPAWPPPAAAFAEPQAAPELAEPDPAEREPVEREPVERDSAERDPAEREPVEREPVERDSAERDSAEREPVEREPVERDSAEREPAVPEPGPEARALRPDRAGDTAGTPVPGEPAAEPAADADVAQDVDMAEDAEAALDDDAALDDGVVPDGDVVPDDGVVPGHGGVPDHEAASDAEDHEAAEHDAAEHDAADHEAAEPPMESASGEPAREGSPQWIVAASRPAGQEPAAETPPAQPPTAQETTAEEPGPGRPAVKEPAAGPPGADDPGADAPAAGESAVNGESAAKEPAAKPAPGRVEVTVVPGVSRYHRSECILIRFLGAGDLEIMTKQEAVDAKFMACRACQPDLLEE